MSQEKLKYVGHPSQLFYAEEYHLAGGRGDGMRILQINNGMGMNLTLSPDRCLDISRLNYMGDNYGYFSPCGYVAPQYFSDKDLDFLRSFTAGFMTTCGLVSAGAPCVDEGEKLGLHGRIANTPAENFYYKTVNENGEDVIKVHATMNEARLFAEKLVLEREITVHTQKNSISIKDTVRNEGGETQPLMLLYHINMGYPLLDSNSEIILPVLKTVARDERAEEGINEWRKMIDPERGFEEQCYYHTLAKKNGRTFAACYNNKIKKGVEMDFDAEMLTGFTQWKQMGERDYVLGLEPSNCTLKSRDVLRKENGLPFIAPGEEKVFTLTINIIAGEEEANKMRKKAADMVL